MKVFLVVLLGLVACAAAFETIDWSKVEPIGEVNPTIQAFRQKHGVNGVAKGPSGRIVGGQEAVPHSIPYQVALLLHTDTGRTAFCGASLISTEYVLTAAHCAEVADNVTVMLAVHNVFEEEPEQVRLNTSDIILHPEWSHQLLIHDLALVKLPQKVELNENITTIRLPSKSDAAETFENVTTLVSGWGWPSDSAGGLSYELRYVLTPTINMRSCNRSYNYILHAEQMCTTGNEKIGPCSGDSGGPMVHDEKDGKPTLLGVVSFGTSLGCEIYYPRVYARVTSYLDWISEVTGIAIRD